MYVWTICALTKNLCCLNNYIINYIRIIKLFEQNWSELSRNAALLSPGHLKRAKPNVDYQTLSIINCIQGMAGN